MQVKTVEGFSLSNHQKRIHKLQGIYNMEYYNSLHFKIDGVLSIPKLSECFDLVVNQHEILRTKMQDVNGMEYPIQIINEEIPISLSYSSSSTEVQNEEESIDIVGNKLNVEEGKVIHIDIKKINEKVYELNVFGSSFCVDFVSLQIIVNQAFDKYSRNHTTTDDEIIQYVDFCQWQNELFVNEEWQVENEFTNSILPFETLHQSSRESNMKKIQKSFPFELSKDIHLMEKKYNVPLSTLLLSGWTIFLSKLACSDLPVGIVMDGRNYEELKSSIGQFEKVIPFQLESDQYTFIQYNQLLQEKIESITEKLEYINPLTILPNPENHIPYQFRYVETDPVNTGDISFKIENFTSLNERFKLLLFVMSTEENLEAFLQFNASIYRESEVVNLLNQFFSFLKKCVSNPEGTLKNISSLSSKEENTLIENLNQNRYIESEKSGKRTILEFIEEQVEKNEGNLAIITNEESITYRDLQIRSDKLACYLKQFVNIEDRVAVCLPRSVEAIISILAVLKSGACFVPIDPKWPVNRINYVLKNSAAKIIITDQSDLSDSLNGLKFMNLRKDQEVIAQQETDSLQISCLPQQSAYILYTSGSTGMPKGVCVQHDSLLNYLIWFEEQFSCIEIKQPFVAELGFDAFLKQVFSPLMKGESIILFSEDEIVEPLRFIEKFTSNQLNTLNCVPSLWKAICEELQKDDKLIKKMSEKLTLLLVGGEKINSSLLQQTWNMFPDIQVVNLFGPTETTSNATFGHLKNELFVPIGKPIKNTKVYILNEQMELTRFGKTGELYIGGIGVARGYLDQAALTADRFVPDPFNPGGRLYKTGDMARLMVSGDLEFLGRRDEQIKLNGKRVNLNEIQAVLRKHSLVSDIIIVPSESKGSSLLAFFTGDVEEDQIKDFAKKWLPQYMVPARFIMLNELPLNSNGKVDRLALKKLYEKLEKETYIPPRTDFEEVMSSVWKGVLNRKQVGITDNFFELGGHSLNATQIISRIRKIYELEIPVSLLFEKETIETMCKAIHELYPLENDYIEQVSKVFLEAQSMVKVKL